MSLDIKKYEAAIPECCHYQTFKEHAERLLLCWGILSAMKRNEKMVCLFCELATRSKVRIHEDLNLSIYLQNIKKQAEENERIGNAFAKKMIQEIGNFGLEIETKKAGNE